ncbi:uncharacterized protein LOC141714530 [Apium graveolens]|uniref:uncharacterized protein LOC141714530 n=1 Tax=Apium graveolens TaxID=4045 RepID=UPI003D7AC317
MNLIGGYKDEIDESIVETLMDMLNQHNELVRQFHTARERFKDNKYDEFGLVLLSSQSASGRPNIIGPTDEVGGRLWQQYVVDAFCAIEQYQLDWVTTHQTTIRSDLYTSIRDALCKGDHDPNYVGKAVVLPASFTGSQRYMSQHFKDALALCRDIRHPSLFLTITCNTKWPEITEMIKSLPGVDVCDVPDIVSRFFKPKLDQLMHLIKKKNYFRKCIGEFQKRGLPHMHMLIWLHPDARPKIVAQIDALVSAEIPDKDTDPVNYAAVSNYMIHEPCGVDNTYSSCMVKGRCMRHFPKRFNGNTYIDDCGFPIYRRRNTGRSIKKKGVFWTIATWRIFGFDVHSRWPSVDRLPIHLPGNKPRQRGDVVGRLTEVHAIGGDLLYIRMLLMRIKGSTSFDELRTVEEIEKLLNDIGKSLKDFPTMPYPPEVFLYNSGNGLIAEETSYDTEQMKSLPIGDDKVPSITENPGDDGLVDFKILEQFIIRGTDNPIQSLFDITYPDFLSNMSSYDYLRSRAILTPTNSLVDDINDFVIEKISGKTHTYFSQDSIDDNGGLDNDFDTAFPVEYLNSINMSCLPKQELQIKKYHFMSLQNFTNNVGNNYSHDGLDDSPLAASDIIGVVYQEIHSTTVQTFYGETKCLNFYVSDGMSKVEVNVLGDLAKEANELFYHDIQ